jgi:xylulokinase
VFGIEQTGLVLLGLGIDIGTTNTKVVLVDLDAPSPLVRAGATAPTPEPADLRVTLSSLISRVVAGSPAPEAVGIASMAETGVPLGPAGEPFTGWLRWTDRRAGAAADSLARRLGRDRLIAATGVRPSAKAPLAKWAWLRAEGPAMTRWAGAAELAGYLLTGRLATDHTLAGRTMAYLLPAEGAPPPDGFDPDLLAEAGLRPEQLPQVTMNGDISGRVTDAAFGLRLGTPVVIAGHDHQVGAYACGVRDPGDVANSLGTAEAVMTIGALGADPGAVGALGADPGAVGTLGVDPGAVGGVGVDPGAISALGAGAAGAGAIDPVEAGRAGMSTVVTVDGRRRAIVAGSASAGAAVDWWLKHESADAALFALAHDQPSTDILIFPYLFGRQAPLPDPSARLRVLGRRHEHTPAQLAQALLEGLSLHTRWMLTEQSRLIGRTPPTVHLFGGPVATNPAWTHIKARVLPTKLQVITESEPVAIGAAMRACGVRTRLPGAVRGPGRGYDAMFTRFLAEAQRAEAERAEAERTEAERTEAQRAEAERTEAQSVEAQRAEAQT